MRLITHDNVAARRARAVLPPANSGSKQFHYSYTDFRQTTISQFDSKSLALAQLLKQVSEEAANDPFVVIREEAAALHQQTFVHDVLGSEATIQI